MLLDDNPSDFFKDCFVSYSTYLSSFLKVKYVALASMLSSPIDE